MNEKIEKKGLNVNEVMIRLDDIDLMIRELLKLNGVIIDSDSGEFVSILDVVVAENKSLNDKLLKLDGVKNE